MIWKRLHHAACQYHCKRYKIEWAHVKNQVILYILPDHILGRCSKPLFRSIAFRSSSIAVKVGVYLYHKSKDHTTSDTNQLIPLATLPVVIRLQKVIEHNFYSRLNNRTKHYVQKSTQMKLGIGSLKQNKSL